MKTGSKPEQSRSAEGGPGDQFRFLQKSYVHIVFPQLPDKLVFAETTEQYLPPGGDMIPLK